MSDKKQKAKTFDPYGHLSEKEAAYCRHRDRLFRCIGVQLEALCDDSPHINDKEHLKRSVAQIIDGFHSDWLVLADLRAELEAVVFYTPEAIEVLKLNTQLSPHTVRCLNNPIHAYLCDGSCNVSVEEAL